MKSTALFVAISAWSVAVLAAYAASGEQPRHLALQQVGTFAIPRMSVPPKIDGVIDLAEWREAVAISGVGEFPSNQILPRPTTFWLGWDDDHLYLACRAWMRPGMTKPNVGGRSPHTADCFDAGMELHFQPTGKNVHPQQATTSFKFNVNALGFDGVLTRVSVGQLMANWLPAFRAKARVTAPGTAPLGGRWLEIEWAGSTKDFELTGPNRAGDTWRMMLGFNSMGYGWTQAVVPISSDYFNPMGFPVATLVENTPAVQLLQEQLPGPRDGVAAATVRAYNPTAAPATLTVLAQYADKDGDLVKKEQPLTVEPGKCAEIVLNEKFPRATDGGTFFFHVTQGDRELLRHRLLFTTGYDKGWVERPPRDPNAKPSFPLSATFNPLRFTLQVSGDSYYVERPETVKALRYRVFKAGETKPLLEGSIDEPRTFYFSRLVQLPELEPGEYVLEGDLRLADGSMIGPQTVKFKKLDEAKVFGEWWGKTAGNIQRVIPPFEALKRGKGQASTDQAADRRHSTLDTLSCWGREYTLDALGLPAAIVSQGKPLLAAPARIVVIENGKRHVIPLTQTPKLTEVHDWRVRFEGSASGGGLVFRGRGWMEQDGLIYLDLSYAPAGKTPVKLDALYVEFPLVAKEAEGLLCLGPGGNFAAKTVKLLPQGQQGRLWSTLETGRMGTGMTVGSFYPSVWIGNEQRGFLWWGDSDKGWVPEDAVPAHEVCREGTEVVLRNAIIGSPFTLDCQRTISFGYNASPFKPLTKGWRASSFSFYGGSVTSVKDPATGKEQQFFHMLTPPFKDSAQWGPFWAEQKKRSDEWFHRKLPYDPGELRKDTGRSLQYSTCLMGYGAKTLQDDVFNYFDAEWKAASCEVYNDSLINYYTWFIDRACREGGLKTIYWDIVFFVSPFSSLQAGTGYVLPDGRNQPGYAGFRARRFLMHTYAIFDENGAMPGAQVGHGTNDYMLVVLPWFDAMLDGEYLHLNDAATMDWVDGYPVERMRVMSCPHAFGTAISWMDLIHFTDKDRRARAMRGQIDYIRLYDSWTNMDMHRLLPGSAAVEWGINDEQAQYVPFWRNPYVQCEDKDVLVSLWRLPDRVLMAAFNNDGKQAKDVTMKVDLAALNLLPRPWKEFIGVRAVEDPGEYGRSSMPKEPEPTLDVYAGTVSVKGVQPHTARIIAVRKY
jgi:hypothetical protein